LLVINIILLIIFEFFIDENLSKKSGFFTNYFLNLNCITLPTKFIVKNITDCIAGRDTEIQLKHIKIFSENNKFKNSSSTRFWNKIYIFELTIVAKNTSKQEALINRVYCKFGPTWKNIHRNLDIFTTFLESPCREKSFEPGPNL